MSLKFLHFIPNNNVSSRLYNNINGNPLHTIIRIDGTTLLNFDKDELSKEEISELLLSSDVLCIHFLNDFSAKIINDNHQQLRVVWFAWGGDIFNLGKFGNQFLLPKTRQLNFRHNLSTWKGFKHLFWKNAGSLADIIPPNREVLKAIDKVELIIPVVKRDYLSLKEKYPVKAELFEANYLNDLMVAKPKVELSRDRKNIVLGNSASFTNNHIEVIDKLANFDHGDSKIHIPLSYGNEWYGSKIKQYAENKLGNNAEVLLDHLPLEDYLNMYASSKQVIMNHPRQQAMGNFVFAMYCKTSMFMNFDGNHTKDMLERGFHLLNVEDYHPENELSEAQKNENRDLLEKWFGKEYLRSRFKQFQQYMEATSSEN